MPMPTGETFEVDFADGPLMMGFVPEPHGFVVNRVAGQSEALGVRVGDCILLVGDDDIEPTMRKQKVAMMIRTATRPLNVRFLRPDEVPEAGSSADAVPSPAPVPPPAPQPTPPSASGHAPEITTEHADAAEPEPLPSKSRKGSPTRRHRRRRTSTALAEAHSGVHGHNLPFLRNPDFVGREQMLEQLARAFDFDGRGAASHGAAGGDLARMVVLRARSGVGKTQVAVELAYRLLEGEVVEHVLWVDASEGHAAESFARAGERVLGLPAAKGASSEERVAVVRATLDAARRAFLIVLDNAADARGLRRLLPKTAACRTLITTRMRGLRKIQQQFDLDVLPGPEAVRVLLRDVDGGEAALDQPERGAATRLVEQLGKLTLALDLASRLLRPVEAGGAGFVPSAVLRRVAAARGRDERAVLGQLLVVLHEQLRPTEQPLDALALEISDAVAFFAPSPPVPLALLLRCTDGQAKKKNVSSPSPSEGQKKRGATKEESPEDYLKRALERLRALGLAQLAPATHELTVHRLVVAHYRTRAGGVPPAALLRRVAGALQAMRWGSGAQATPRDVAFAAVLHARAAVQYAFDKGDKYGRGHGSGSRRAAGTGGGDGEDDETTTTELAGEVLMAIAGIALNTIQQPQIAIGAYERVLPMQEAEYGPGHAKLAVTLKALGSAYGDLGEPQKQVEKLEQALAIEEAAYGPEVANTLDNLGSAYGEAGDAQKQVQVLERALAIKVAAHGAEDVEVGVTLAALGSAYAACGDVTQEVATLQRASTIFNSADHPLAPRDDEQW
eukprot:g1361.t1